MESLKHRFSLKYCSFDNILSYAVWTLRCIGVNIDNQSDESYGALLLAWCYFSALLCVYLYLVSAVYYLVAILAVSGELAEAVVVVGTGFTSSISTLKYAFVILYRKELATALDLFRSVDARWPPRSRHGTRAALLLRTIKLRCNVCYFGLVLNSVGFCIKPLFLLPGAHWPVDELQLMGLTPKTEGLNYEIGLTLFILGAYMATMAPAAVFVLFTFLVGYIEAHVLALADDFENLWSDVLASLGYQENDSGAEINKIELGLKIKEKIRDLIRQHVDLITLFRTVNDLFQLVIFLEFMLTIFALFSIFLGGVENAVFVMVYSSLQLFVNCLLGQKLTQAGVEFERRVWECGWENFDAANMKSIQLVLQSTQRSLVIKAGGLTTLSLTSFLMIVKSIYSAYATFQRNV